MMPTPVPPSRAAAVKSWVVTARTEIATLAVAPASSTPSTSTRAFFAVGFITRSRLPAPAALNIDTRCLAYASGASAFMLVIKPSGPRM